MSEDRQVRQLAAIVFTDLVGFTELMETDEDRAREIVRVQRALIDSCAGRHGGRILKEIGDGMLLMFGSGVEALRCAIEIQQAEKDFRLRIGVHIGDVVIDDEEVYGSGVNVASRIEGLAEPDGICLSRDAWYQARNQTDLDARFIGKKHLKGIREPVEVFQLRFGKEVGGQAPLPDETGKPPGATGNRKRIYALASVLVLSVMAGMYLVFDRFAVSPPPSEEVAVSPEPDGVRPEPSIAVLPFADMSADRDQDYFAEGLAEEILNLLAGIDGLRVTGRTSSFAFGDKDIPIPEIGQTLGVAHVLEGSVRKDGERFRVTAQLVEADTGFHLWSERFDRELEDIFAIQDEIADAIALALQVTLKAESIGTDSLEAYEHYLRGRKRIYRRTHDDLERARSLLDHALALDPDYAPALATSAEVRLLLSDVAYGDVPVSQANSAAREELNLALELDGELAEAHAALGLLAYHEWDLDTAQGHLERALQLNPSLSGANHWKGLLLGAQGRLREGIEHRERFLTLDPLFIANKSNLIDQYRRMGDYTTAEQLFDRMMENHPDNPLTWGQKIRLLMDQGELARAVEVAETVLEEIPGHQVFEEIYYRLGEFGRAAEVADERGYSRLGARVLIEVKGAEAALEQSRAALEHGPLYDAVWLRLIDGLVWAGKHEELVSMVDEKGGLSGPLEDRVRHFNSFAHFLTALATAEHQLGRAELKQTLSEWRDRLDMMNENGYGAPWYYFMESCYHALADDRAQALEYLETAMEAGFREPLLARHPAFAPMHEDPEFEALAKRMVELINVERGRADLAPLSI